ncbi:MAG TPA: DUF2726 domain-containing protein [Burkholderiaceae bacterium]|jgi:hypothetical protein|nr:DUF2726 domain-containing protein [Burkholderiaceae bacterium]
MALLWMLVAVALVGAVAWAWRRQSQGATAHRKPGALDALDTVTGWEPQATRILTSSERLAYATLQRAMPEYLILAQVPLSRFLRVPTRYSYAEWLARVGQLCADLVVCDSSSQVLAVVEVRAAAQSERGGKRAERMRRVLKAAGVPLHVWSEQALPSVSAAREMLLPQEKREAAAPAPVPAPAAPPVLGTLPAPTNGAAHALPEMRDPPPSTWFDDLDVQPSANKKPH